MFQILFIHDLSFWLQLYMLTSDNLQAKSSSANQLIHEQIKDLNVAWMITDGKYQFCSSDCVSRNPRCVLVNVIVKHGGKVWVRKHQEKLGCFVQLRLAFSVFSLSPVPSPLKIRLVSHTPFSMLDSVYKPLHRSDLPSCVQSPGQTSYALSFHYTRLFPLHSQARVDILPGLHLLSGVEGEFWATLWPRSDFTMAADDLNNRRELHKSKSAGNFTLSPGVNWTSWGLCPSPESVGLDTFPGGCPVMTKTVLNSRNCDQASNALSFIIPSFFIPLLFPWDWVLCECVVSKMIFW